MPVLRQVSWVLVAVFSNTYSSAEPRVYQVDEPTSSMVVHVGKAGLFSFAGHNHSIKVTGFQGQAVADPKAIGKSSVELIFPSSGLRVEDSKEPAGDAPKVQDAMQGTNCLDVSRYPEIHFHSTKVSGQPAGLSGYNLTITGELELHGVKGSLTFPAQARIENGNLTVTGTIQIKQRDYGIEPISAVGGSVKVRNELGIEFSIVAKATAASR